MSSKSPRKTCSRCKQSKSIDNFSTDRSSKDGRGFECKECSARRMRVFRAANPERALEHSRKQQARHSTLWHTDPEWRALSLKRNRDYRRRRYQADPEFRRKASESTKRYLNKRKAAVSDS